MTIRVEPLRVIKSNKEFIGGVLIINLVILF